LADEAIPSKYAQDFADLLAKSPDELTNYDIAKMNLLCASGLPGSEDLDIEACLSTIDRWTNLIRAATLQNLVIFRRNPALFGNCTEARAKAALLVTFAKRNLGARYCPEYIRLDGDYSDVDHKNAHVRFIEGMIAGSQPGGTCSSIPYLLVALGRRLGYPMYVITTKTHLFARWDDGEERFNIEASNAAGMESPDDEYYRGFPIEWTEEERSDPNNRNLQNLTPVEELVDCLNRRVAILTLDVRVREEIESMHKICCLMPECRERVEAAHTRVKSWLVYLDSWKRYPTDEAAKAASDAGARVSDSIDPHSVLLPKDAAMCISIFGHFYEINKWSPLACLITYSEAWRLDLDNPNYRRDVERMIEVVKKHNISDEQNRFIPKRRIDGEMSAFLEARGKKHEAAGRLADAMTAYVESYLHNPRSSTFRQTLLRVVTREFNTPDAPIRFTLYGSVSEDPRNALPPDGKAILFAARAELLEALQHYKAARHNFANAGMCAPYYVEYHVATIRTDAKYRGQLAGINDVTPINGEISFSHPSLFNWHSELGVSPVLSMIR
jgi:hypothetical protein